MRRPRVLSALTFCVAVIHLGSGSSLSRDYVPSAWSSTFYRPEQVRIEGVGIVNQDVVFFQTRWGVSALHEGFLTPVLEAPHGDEITAFHLCHHRSSFFYEVRAHEGGTLSIFEYSLISSDHKPHKVGEFQDTVEATALACVDHLLLRASPASLLSLHLQTDAVSVLRKHDASDVSDAIASLAVGYAADVASRAKIFAAVPRNRTVVRLHLTADGSALLDDSEVVISGGDGLDGPVGEATAREPSHVLWARGKVLFVDGCSLREVRKQRVRTLLGAPELCPEAANETVEPVPWASRLSRPLAVAGSAESTARASVLLLTRGQVVEVEHREDACSEAAADAECSARKNGCGWAEGAEPDQHVCFECARVEEWATRQRPAVEACSLELAPRVGTRYSLTGCGCMAPPPAPAPAPPAPSDEDSRNAVQAVLAVLLLLVATVAAVLLYRGYRRAAVMHELYGVDTAEFHTFNDEECMH